MKRGKVTSHREILKQERNCLLTIGNLVSQKIQEITIINENMKTFVAYRFSGEDTKDLEPLLTAVRDSLQAKNVEVYCTFFDDAELKDKSKSARQIMEHAFKIIDKSDFLFVIQTSDNKSEGMLMEVGYCRAKNIPIVVATKNPVSYTYIPQMGGISFRWSGVNDLVEKIKNTDFSTLF